MGAYRVEFEVSAHDEAGVATIDALVALLILSMTVILSSSVLRQASRAAEMAQETRSAEMLLVQVLEAGPRSFASSSGERDGFVWRLDTALTGSEQYIEVCRRAASVRNRESGRVFAAATLDTCPPTEGV